MGLFDKVKSAMNAVTGGAAKVSLEVPGAGVPGGRLPVKISVMSTGGEIKSGGVFIDLLAREAVSVKASEAQAERDISLAKTTFERSFPINGALTIAANETKLFEGEVALPAEVLPTFTGSYVKHEWQIRARLEAFGNDPDSGFQSIRVGAKA